MTQRRALPRICIALGLPDIRGCSSRHGAKPKRAKTSSNSVSTIWPTRNAGAQCHRAFLEDYPECTVLATCRRHQNHGKFNGSIDEQFARARTAPSSSGARAVDVEIETAEVVPERCAELRGRA